LWLGCKPAVVQRATGSSPPVSADLRQGDEGRAQRLQSPVQFSRREEDMSFEQSLAHVTTVADFDAVDVVGLIAKYGILSMLCGLVALVFAIGIAALLDDRPLKEIFNISNFELEKIGSRRRAAAS
jgi:hypothetical protein